MHINARGLWGGTVKCDGRLSSQFVSSLLLALPMAAGDACIEMLGDATSKPYIDLTLQVMRDFGVVVEHDAYQTFYVKGNQVYQAPQVYTIEPDISSASYFMAAAAIRENPFKSLRVEVCGANLLRCALTQMGACVEFQEDGLVVAW